MYGRRAAWYAVVRALRPAVVVESGVHDGLGSAVVLRALERNAEEGHDGSLIGIDIDPSSGWLVPPDLQARFKLQIGDSLTTLKALPTEPGIQIFIHDSDHRYDHEWSEYEIVESAAGPHMTLISDNAHAESALLDFARVRGRPYGYCAEVSIGHFYPGAGIGISPSRL
jgi:hypothetical protein